MTSLLYVSNDELDKAGLLSFQSIYNDRIKHLQLKDDGECVQPLRHLLKYSPSPGLTVRFNHTPAYVEGNINVAGFKWIGGD